MSDGDEEPDRMPRASKTAKTSPEPAPVSTEETMTEAPIAPEGVQETDAAEAETLAPDAETEAPWEGGDAEEAPEAEAEPEPVKPPPPSMVEILRARLQERDDQLHTYIAAYKQAKDEMAKAQERMKRDQAKQVSRAKMGAARDLLDVLDNLDRTVQGAPPDGPAASLAQGVGMVHKQFLEVLVGFGVERMDALGGTFDPKLHEAVGMIPAPPGKADQEILFVQRAGYLFDGQLLRAAQVIVAAAQ
jgi:molecular chaperone GrpE